MCVGGLMSDFDSLNPAFEDQEPYVAGYFEDEDGVFDLPNDFDEDLEDEDILAMDEELYGEMYEGHDGRYYEDWGFDT